MHLAYAGLLNLALNGLTITAADLAVSLPISVACAAAAAAALPSAPRSPAAQEAAATRTASVAVLAALLLVGAATPARAHDPGQGPSAGSAALRATATGDQLHLDAALDPAAGCDQLTTTRITARRAGATLTAPAQPLPGCRAQGTLTLPARGRWFVYLEAHGPIALDPADPATTTLQPLETWLPITLDPATQQPVTATRTADLYSPPRATRGTSTGQAIGGIALYSLGAVLIALTIRTYRHLPPRRPLRVPA